jgi:UrcA family protein
MADLDLQSTAGASALLGRIQAAAKEFCGPRPHVLELQANEKYAFCVRDAMDGAVAAVDEPLVSDLYDRYPAYASLEERPGY